MAAPNPQLEAAIQEFAQQPGVTPEQVAQLRAAITAPPALTTIFNQDAGAGNLSAFALAPPGATRIGTYDPGTGVVTLPAEVLPGTGSTADIRSVLKLQDMSLRFAHQPGVDAEMHANLQKTLNDSPVLAAQFMDSVRDGATRNLNGFALHTQGVAGGSYDPDSGVMHLTPASLAMPTFREHDLAFVLGHEMQHGANRAAVRHARAQFHAQLKAIAGDADPVNDYTGPIALMKAANRSDEASATIAGWNAMLSYEKQRSGNPAAGLQEMWDNGSHGRVLDFLELDAAGKAVPRAGLAFNSDGTLTPSPPNVEAMGRYYFDQPPTGTLGVAAQDTVGIGPLGHSDYTNYYGAGLVSEVIFYERSVGVPKHGDASRMQLNMSKLGFSEKLLEENGIFIAAGSNASQPYHDTGTTPPTPGQFDHTADGPHAHQHVPAKPDLDHGITADVARLDAIANDPLYRQVQAAVHRLDASMGRVPDAASDAMTASLYALARESGLQRVDHAVLSVANGRVGEGENVFVVQGQLQDPLNRIASMKTLDAVSTPRDVALDRALQAATAPSRDQKRHAAEHDHGAPAISLSR